MTGILALIRRMTRLAQSLAGGVLALSWLIIPAIVMWSVNP